MNGGLMAETMQLKENKQLERFSYSKISTYSQCRFKYKIKYEDKNFIFTI